MLKEAEIRTFIEGTTNYFETAGQQAARQAGRQAAGPESARPEPSAGGSYQMHRKLFRPRSWYA